MKRWDSLVSGYLRVCEARGLSSESLDGIRDEMDRLGCWMKRRRPQPRLEDVGHEILIEYLKRRTHFHAKSTVSSIASKMRCMGEYLVHQGVWQQNPMRWVKGPRLDPRGKLPRRIGSAHLSKLWEATAQQRGAYSKHLSVVVLALLYGTGLRRGELERLQVKDWDREQNVLAVDGRKTANERSIPLSEPIARCLESYLPLRQNQLERWKAPEEKSLLINRYGAPLSAQSIGLLLHRLARKAGVPLVTVHQFRHTCASDLLENGASLPEVQTILGHKCVETTSRYLHIAGPERVHAMKKHPLNAYLSEVLAREKETTRS
jgi:site-specific recombinase XerD